MGAAVAELARRVGARRQLHGFLGQPDSFTNVTYAENEERSPWEPFHVSKGFRAEDSTASIFGSMWHTAFTLGLREAHWRDAVRRMLTGMDPLSRPCFVLDPLAARQFVERGGFDTKQKLIDWAFEVARLPAGEYWDSQLIQSSIPGRRSERSRRRRI